MEPENCQRSESGLNQKEIHAIEEVISKVKSAGLFDQFRKECLADVDTKPAYHNLVQRVEKFVERFLNSQKWNSDLNKNQLRETLRRQLNNSGVMTIGVDRIIEQVVNPKILLGIKPKIDEAICDYFGINLKTLHTEQQKRKQQHQQYMLQHQQFQQNPLQDLMNQHMKPEDAFGAAPGMYPSMTTYPSYPWLPVSADAGFHGTANPGMTEVSSSVDPGAVSGISYNPHSFGGMMQPYFMGSWMPGIDSFNHSMQPVISGQPLIHGQSMPAFGDGGFSPFDAGVTPFSATPSPSIECSNVSFDTHSLPNLLPSIPSHVLPGTPLPSIGSPRAPEITQQPSTVVPPGIFTTGTPGSVIKPPPPGSIPPPPGTVPVVPFAQYTLVQSSLQPMPAAASIAPLAFHSLPKELIMESVPETIDQLTKVHPSITRPPPDGSLTSMCPSYELSVTAEVVEGYQVENSIQALNPIGEIAKSDHCKLESKRDSENGRQTLDVQIDEDPLPLQSNLGDIQMARFLSENEESFNASRSVEETENSCR